MRTLAIFVAVVALAAVPCAWDASAAEVPPVAWILKGLAHEQNITNGAPKAGPSTKTATERQRMILFEDKISSAVARVRIALALKGQHTDSELVSILGADPHSHSAEYRRINPQGLVPALLTDEGGLLTQSLAIIEYLDERFPEPALLPTNLEARAHARAIAVSIAAEVHALLPPRVGARLRALPWLDPAVIPDWNRHWIVEGLTAVEALLARQKNARFCVGQKPSLADIFLFPQAINTERAGIQLERWPRISAIVTLLRAIPAFAENAPTPRV